MAHATRPDNVPLNIKRRVREEMMHAQKNATLREQSIVAQTAKWSEKQGSRGAGKSKEELKREEQEEETEITEMARQLQVIRRERLRRLYQGETAQWERELNAQGLALAKDLL